MVVSYEFKALEDLAAFFEETAKREESAHGRTKRDQRALMETAAAWRAAARIVRATRLTGEA